MFFKKLYQNTLEVAYVTSVFVTLYKASEIVYESLYYLKNGSKVHYPVYRINNKHILVGSCHVNQINTVDKKIFGIMKECKNLYNEISLSHEDMGTSIFVEELIENINSTTENKILTIEKYLELKKMDESIIPKSLVYPKSFLEKITFKDISLTQLLFIHRAVNEIYAMDHIINIIFKNDKKPIFALDEIPEAAVIRQEFLNTQVNEKVLEESKEKSHQEYTYDIDQCFQFFYKFPNFLEWYSNDRTDYEIKRDHIIEYFFPNKMDDKLVDCRDKAWLTKLKPAMQLEDSSLILVGMAHCKGLVKGLREDYVVEKYNYASEKFEKI